MWLTWLCVLPCLAYGMRIDSDRLLERNNAEEEEEIIVNRNRRQIHKIAEQTLSVTAPLFSSRLFDYGNKAKDNELPKALDVGKKVDLARPLKFFGQDYSTIYILSNGGIGFESNARSFNRSGLFPGGGKIIAPLWNRNDLRNGGHVFYREVTSGRVLDRGQSEIRYQYEKELKVTSAIIVTWEKMQPIKEAPLPEENTNTFQVALFNTKEGTFANFIYSDIGWIQGAEAGFSKGDGVQFYALPTSGTPEITYLEENGNTGIPGEWMFELGEKRIVRCKAGIKGNTCDEECSSGEWGADCLSCCHCSRGSCHPLTGDCAGGCSNCWSGKACQTKVDSCSARNSTSCAVNAISFTDYDRCGEPVQRCNCLAGFTGDGYKSCQDINECATSVCHKNAICTNTPGRHFCHCKEGFNGDGITVCEKSFLFPSEGHQALPKSKNSKVQWKLRSNLKIIGEIRDKLTISTSGLISLADIPVITAHLDEMKMSGIVPFFAPIDISRTGLITVAETTDGIVLTRASQLIRENYRDNQFQPKSAVIVTFTNVTDGKNMNKNTLQAVLVGGSSPAGEAESFAILLYKDITWSEGAEAGIMSNDITSSIALPGSGTVGIEQLPQLSNVNNPGVWIYRIDTTVLSGCPSPSLIPPYCTEETKNKVEAFHRPSQNRKPTESQKSEEIPIGAPRIITPSFEDPRKSKNTLSATVAPTTQRTARPRPQFESTPHRPLVSLGAEDFHLEPDVFEPVQTIATIIPEILIETTVTTKQMTDEPSTETATTAMTDEVEETTFPNFNPKEEGETIQQIRTTLDKSNASTEENVKDKNNVKPTVDEQEDEVPSTIEEITVARGSTAFMETGGEKVDEKKPKMEEKNDSQPIFVFTTSTEKPTTTRMTPVTRSRAAIVTAKTNTQNAQNNSELEESKLAIIVPLGIAAVWVLIIIAIILCVCCRKRSSALMKGMGGSNYGVRPTAFAMKRGSKNLETGSYEDHLEKAARLSNDMNAYNQQGRLSLYGSYWNLQNQDVTPPTRQSPPSPFIYQPRYTYTARY